MSHPNQQTLVIKRHKPSYEVTDYGAKFEGGGHVANLDLPPALNKMVCRDCGARVPTDTCRCLRCGGGK